MKIKMLTTTTLAAMNDGPGPTRVANKRFITTWTDVWCLVLTEDNTGEARSGNDNKGKARIHVPYAQVVNALIRTCC